MDSPRSHWGPELLEGRLVILTALGPYPFSGLSGRGSLTHLGVQTSEVQEASRSRNSSGQDEPDGLEAFSCPISPPAKWGSCVGLTSERPGMNCFKEFEMIEISPKTTA